MSEEGQSKSHFIILSVLMFLQFWIWGSWYISVPAFLGGIDFMNHDVYYTYKAGPLGAMIAPFFLGLIADRFFNTEKILAFLFAGCGATMLMMPYIANLPGTEFVMSTSVSAINF